MKINIAIITTEFLYEHLLHTIVLDGLDYNVEILCYKNFEDLETLCLKSYDRFDGFLFSGLFPIRVIKDKFNNISKPYSYFLSSELDYYKLLLNLTNTDKNLNLDRVYLDLDNNLKNYISDNTFNEYLNKGINLINSTELENLPKLEKFIESEHIRIWNEGKTDLCITRFSSIIPSLERNNVKYNFVYPDKKYILDIFDNLVDKIKLKKFTDSKPIVINVTINSAKGSMLFDSHDISSKFLSLQNAINQFNKNNIYNFIVQKNYVGFEIYSNMSTLVGITDNLTNCKLYAHFKDVLNFDVCIGYGIGIDINQSKLNAINANRESFLNHEHKSYIINESNDIIGPLNSNEIITISNTVDDYISKIAKKAKLSTLTVQKIISAMRYNSSNEITAANLASILSITPRSANRFLSNLVSSDLAVISYEKQRSTKGRPEKVYTISIDF
ncbi:MAG: hypothetical protein ACRDD7_07560 [Peptostreptococcaceae bacterium]